MPRDLEREELDRYEALGKDVDPSWLDSYLKTKFPTPLLFHVAFLDGKVSLLDSVGKELALSVEATLDFRGIQGNRYVFEQTLPSGKTLHFSLLPNSDQSSVFLAMRVSPAVPLRAKLQVEGITKEGVEGFEASQWFEEPLPLGKSSEIILFQENEEIGRVQFRFL